MVRFRRRLPCFQILGRNSSSRKRFFAVLIRRSAHVSFKIRQSRTARAGYAVSALRAGWHIAQCDRPNLIQLWGIAPDIRELGAPHVATGEWKLHAGINVSVRRNVASRMPGAAWQLIHVVFTWLQGRRAILLNVSTDQRFVPENLA